MHLCELHECVYAHTYKYTCTYTQTQGDAQGDWQLWAALEQCHFADVVRSWAGRLDANLQENGAPLTPEHRQQLCIARALLACDVRGCSILCLEDVIGTTDRQTENLILGRHIGAGQAVLLFCEDPRMCPAGVDRAVIVENGSARLLEDGDLQEFLHPTVQCLGVSPAEADMFGFAEVASLSDQKSLASTSPSLASDPVSAAGGMLWNSVKSVGRATGKVVRPLGKLVPQAPGMFGGSSRSLRSEDSGGNLSVNTNGPRQKGYAESLLSKAKSTLNGGETSLFSFSPKPSGEIKPGGWLHEG